MREQQLEIENVLLEEKSSTDPLAGIRYKVVNKTIGG
jgi:hypothetical protein